MKNSINCFLTLVACALLFFGCSMKKVENIELEIIIGSKISFDRKLVFDNYLAYAATISIVNNSDSPIKFWLMSCSWQDNFITPSKNLFLFIDPCDANYPQIESLTAHSKKYLNAVLLVLNADTNSVYQKLGFIYINQPEYNFDLDYKEVLSKRREDMKNIVWSNSFIINREY